VLAERAWRPAGVWTVLVALWISCSATTMRATSSGLSQVVAHPLVVRNVTSSPAVAWGPKRRASTPFHCKACCSSHACMRARSCSCAQGSRRVAVLSSFNLIGGTGRMCSTVHMPRPSLCEVAPIPAPRGWRKQRALPGHAVPQAKYEAVALQQLHFQVHTAHLIEHGQVTCTRVAYNMTGSLPTCGHILPFGPICVCLPTILHRQSS
jgi:hypothetical protein